MSYVVIVLTVTGGPSRVVGPFVEVDRAVEYGTKMRESNPNRDYHVLALESADIQVADEGES